jgi:hypothetical protein
MPSGPLLTGQGIMKTSFWNFEKKGLIQTKSGDSFSKMATIFEKNSSTERGVSRDLPGKMATSCREVSALVLEMKKDLGPPPLWG